MYQTVTDYENITIQKCEVRVQHSTCLYLNLEKELENRKHDP